MKAGETLIPDDFIARYGEELTEWLAKEFPAVDAAPTLRNFVEWGDEKTRYARKWQVKFKRMVRRGMQMKWAGIIEIKRDREFDPRWAIIHQARKEGFRDPEPQETPQSYETDFKQWRTSPLRLPFDITRFSSAVRRV